MLVLVFVVFVWLLIGVVAIARAEIRNAEERSPLAAAARGVGKVLGGFTVACATEIGLMAMYLVATVERKRSA